MGNPLAPTLANFLLGHLETEMWNKINGYIPPSSNVTCPALYIRYVDDVFCVFRENDDHKPFMNALNGLHTSISFTCEVGGSSMPFLDILIELKSNNFHSTVYRKETNNGVLMQYRSNAPNKWKEGLIKCFAHRAKVLCSDERRFQEEMSKLRTLFSNNGYPHGYFERVIKNYGNNGPERDKDDPTTRVTLKVPFVGKPSLLSRARRHRIWELSTAQLELVTTLPSKMVLHVGSSPE